MRHHVYQASEKYPVALLVKATAFQADGLDRFYRKPLVDGGIPEEELIFFSLAYGPNNKAPVKLVKQSLDALLPAMDSVGVKCVYCADATYFKVLVGERKAEPHLGYALPCKIKGYEHLTVILGVNHTSLVYNPNNESKLALSLQTLIQVHQGNVPTLGQHVLKDAHYPVFLNDIQAHLVQLMKFPALSCDIETASLEHDKAGIGTIAFSWDDCSGVAFAVDYVPYEEPQDGVYGRLIPNHGVRQALRQFFEHYTGSLKFHRANYDTKVMIYELWMDHPHDTAGLLHGLHLMYRKLHDTKIIAYLALNSVSRNSYSLKDLAHEHAGNWAQEDIKDITRIPLPQLLEYNLVDAASTNYVFDKYYPKMVDDQQLDIYQVIMLPSLKVITQMELTGMPLNPDKVQDARQELEQIKASHEAGFAAHPAVKQTEDLLTQSDWEKWEAEYKEKLKTAKQPKRLKVKTRADIPQRVFNPDSPQQMQILLYDVLGLPVLDTTDTKQPATGDKTIKKLLNHTGDVAIQDLLEHLRGWSKAQKILSTFITAFERAIDKGDKGIVWLHGSFNLGGTVSGRLSSSDPNLQNLPAGSKYGKLIKSCFMAPKGWLFGGADFNSLEDYVSALTTKDPNKLKVYLEGYDGHCLRAFSYFPDRLPDIVDTVESINSIADKYPEIRQESKAPTFALTYQGTHYTLMNNLGFPEAVAKQIEANYHELYKVSDEWVQAKLDQAAIDGYVTVAFGLRVRTPLLARSLRNHSSTPYEAQAEGRTAGNALGQSYGMLTNRALNAFMQKVWDSPYRLDILPVATIHDAIYLLMKDDIEVVKWVNDHLIQEMQWQNLPEIQHDQVKLGAELDLFYPSWAQNVTLPNYASIQEIRQRCEKHLRDLANPKK